MKILSNISPKMLDKLDDEILIYIKTNHKDNTAQKMHRLRQKIWHDYCVIYPYDILRNIILYKLNRNEINKAYKELLEIWNIINI